jgi:hypothetical protein
VADLAARPAVLLELAGARVRWACTPLVEQVEPLGETVVETTQGAGGLDDARSWPTSLLDQRGRSWPTSLLDRRGRSWPTSLLDPRCCSTPVL